MNTEELKREIEMSSYTENPNSLVRVIDVDTVLELIDELANNNESIDLVIEPTKIERNMLVWFNDDIHEVEFIIDDRIEVKELRSGTVFVATKEELTPVR